jgi:copper chaperone CopZ
MENNTINEIPLTAIGGTGGGCCGGGSCGCGHGEAAQSTATSTSAVSADAVTTDYLVTGMTCSHCVSSVTEELSALAGVAGVRVDLHANGVSRVTVDSDARLDVDDVRDAILDAGYRLQEA